MSAGIHGEAGVRRMKVRGGFSTHPPAPRAPPLCPHTPPCPLQVLPADEAVETMLAHMTDPSSASHLPLRPGEPQNPP